MCVITDLHPSVFQLISVSRISPRIRRMNWKKVVRPKQRTDQNCRTTMPRKNRLELRICFGLGF